jgi:hypothetical protein
VRDFVQQYRHQIDLVAVLIVESQIEGRARKAVVEQAETRIEARADVGLAGRGDKSVKISMVPAAPSTAPFSSQGSGSNAASMRTGTALVMVAPQMFAACWNAIRRCSPSVRPLLPPTGGAGVGSLKPTPASLPLMMVIVVAA